jgi:hypothetical protein
MWSGGVINTCDGHDFVNVVYQSRHLNKIIARLEMFSPFRELHREDRKILLQVQSEPLGVSLFMKRDYES